MKQIKNLLVVLMAFFALVGVAFASPVIVTSLNVQEVNGNYVGIVTLQNLDIDSNNIDCAHLYLGIDNVSSLKDVGTVTVPANGTKVLTFDLSKFTSDVSALKKGEAYTLEAKTSDQVVTVEKSFLYGTEKTTNGLGLIVDNVRVDGYPVDNDVIDVQNGEDLTVTIRFTAQENFDNARLMVFIEGYEHSPLIATTDVFSVVKGNTYFKTLHLKLPSDMVSEKEYKLRIAGANDLSGITYKEYSLYVDTQRNRVDILDLITTPSTGVQPGENLVANVRVKNRGQKEQDSVKVTVAIPKLGVTSSSYITNLNPEDVATSDDMLLTIPTDAKAGNYNVEVTLSYNDGYTVTEKNYTITVYAPQVQNEKSLIVNYKNDLEIKAGQVTSFQVIVANPNADSKPITITPANDDWAKVDVTPALAMVKGGDSQIYTVKVQPNSDVSGKKVLTLDIKSGDNELSTIKVNTTVESTTTLNWLNIALLIILGILIIVLIILVVVLVKKGGSSKEEEKDEESDEEYY